MAEMRRGKVVSVEAGAAEGVSVADGNRLGAGKMLIEGADEGSTEGAAGVGVEVESGSVV
jgi:hypothetical protein